MTNYSSTFIPNFANIPAPLRKLTCKGEVFQWIDACEEAHNKLKEALKNQVTMAYFDHTKETKLIVDGSRKDGLAAILSQKGANDDYYRPIRYDSRATTAAEKNYSQLEIESKTLYIYLAYHTTRPAQIICHCFHCTNTQNKRW